MLCCLLLLQAFIGTAKADAAAKESAATAAAASGAAAGGEAGEAEVKLSLGGKARAFVGALKPAYWQALMVVGVLYFARYDWSFVVLRAKQVGHPIATSAAIFVWQ